MQIKNMVNVRYSKILPDGSTSYVLAKSNVVNTNIFKKPTVVVVNRPLNQNNYVFERRTGNNFAVDVLIFLFLNQILKWFGNVIELSKFKKCNFKIFGLYFFWIFKKKSAINMQILLAEGTGFEPAVPQSTHAFQACTLDHSDILP